MMYYNEDGGGGDSLGLTTSEALKSLHDGIQRTLQEYYEVHEIRKHKGWWRDSLHHSSHYSTLCWISILTLTVDGLLLCLAYFIYEYRFGNLLLEGFILFILIAANLFVLVRDNKLRHLEVPQKVHEILELIKDAENTCNWLPENYPHLCSPYSPCITVQWTYRDNHVVNLPWALLVKGDVILIRPGQMAPGYCSPLEEKDGPVLHNGEIYRPSNESTHETFSTPMTRPPYRNQRYRLEETPYLNNLKLILEQALNRPISTYCKERHRLLVDCVERMALPSTVLCVVFINLLRYLYIGKWLGYGHWTEMFIIQPVSISLPLLPLMFPIVWLLLDTYGVARIDALLLAPKCVQTQIDPFEETDLEDQTETVVDINFVNIIKCLINLIRGNTGRVMYRSANIIHVLGSLSALCCVDKKGILSWPNPTAEKVFFLRSSGHGSHSPSMSSMDDHTFQDQFQFGIVEEEEDEEEGMSKSSCATDHAGIETVAEVLDLTHDHASPFTLHFDDPTWKQHLNSLKPLGLAILLNTCNCSTQEHYAQFCAHITCEALHNEDLVPVTNRSKNLHPAEDSSLLPGANKCLCELAKQIGFVDQAQDIFHLEEQLSTFRHVQPDMVRRDIKFARSLPIAKLKFPFPHMVAVIVREKSQGGLQLMSQGTADIILDSCVEFWDGGDLCPFTANERKKVLDFYQRTSLTAYCTAFAYRPLSQNLSKELSKLYLELPPESKHLYMPHRSPTPLTWDLRCRSALGQFHSTDSLLGCDTKEETPTSGDGYFELQCNQVFIGMVTMQYQAQTDMVKLIDQLERACIRFVHFSKENELRSRVFSEKMGLESGWNCHISLLSDNKNRSESGHLETGAHLSPPSSLPKYNTQQDGDLEEDLAMLHTRSNLATSRVISYSAPSAINLEFSQVKFEEEPHDWFDKSVQNKTAMSHRDQESEDSMLIQSTDLPSHQETSRSLSCLTDSTEQEAPINFDMSNRAKLPRGIENIRPHLEQIDNVPLLVSLFTDCTPSVTREMLHIMQEYNEVVCVMGSSANADNASVFLQADAAIAVEPLYPQVCQKIPVCVLPPPSCGPSPIELSRVLNSLPCSLSFHREDPVSIFHLIMECRHYMLQMWNCVQFWVCCMASVSVVQLLSVLLMLPPLFPVGSVLWLVCLIIPLLAVSLIGSPTDPQVMQNATTKNNFGMNTQVIVFVLWCYGLKFLPTIFIVLFFYVLMLSSFCSKIAVVSNSTCSFIYPDMDEDTGGNWGGWKRYEYDLLIAQIFTLFVMVAHLLTISHGFVQRDYSIWQKCHRNTAWYITVIIVFALHTFYTLVILETATDTNEEVAKISPALEITVFGLLSPILVLVISELVKREEIKVNVRYQKRARLDFGTKLGMNSPF